MRPDLTETEIEVLRDLRGDPDCTVPKGESLTKWRMDLRCKGYVTFAGFALTPKASAILNQIDGVFVPAKGGV